MKGKRDTNNKEHDKGCVNVEIDGIFCKKCNEMHPSMYWHEAFENYLNEEEWVQTYMRTLQRFQQAPSMERAKSEYAEMLEVHGICHLSEDGVCFVCGRKTAFVDVNTMLYVCSEECKEKGRDNVMRILVDADACPSVNKIEEVAKKNGWQVLLFVDTCHAKHSEYCEVRVCDKGADSVDFALVNECRKDDVVITHDYGLAAMVLGKGARAMHSNGWWYSNENIDRLLMERHEVKKKRKSSKNHIKGPAKRTVEDEERFERCLRSI